MFAVYPFPPTKVPVPVSSLVDDNVFIAMTNKIGTMGEFPAGPVVRTICFHCQGPGFDPWLENFDPASQKRKRKENQESI